MKLDEGLYLYHDANEAFPIEVTRHESEDQTDVYLPNICEKTIYRGETTGLGIAMFLEDTFEEVFSAYLGIEFDDKKLEKVESFESKGYTVKEEDDE